MELDALDLEEPARRHRGRPRGWNDSRAKNMIKSLDRAMEVLEYVSEHQGEVLSDLARGLGQSPATVYRTLVTLEARDMVEFDQDRQTWFMGPRAFMIGARFLRRTSTIERARPILRDLMEVTGETANLGIIQQGQVLFVSQAETHKPIRAFFPPGSTSPFHASGIGKALMAHMPREKADGFIQEPMERFTETTLTTREAVLADLDEIRARGFALDLEEKVPGMICIAAPVFNIFDEAVASISVSGPAARLGETEIAEYAVHVTDAATRLTNAIGGKVTLPLA